MSLSVDHEARERELKLADLANKEADIYLELEQRRWEPWKALSAAFGAGVAVASGLIALAAYVLAHFGR